MWPFGPDQAARSMFKGPQGMSLSGNFAAAFAAAAATSTATTAADKNKICASSLIFRV